VYVQVRTVVEWYMEGLHWVMQYYYRGVPSWSWFYPFHYAPFLSDMKDLQSIHCEFTLSEPVKPFQQVRALQWHCVVCAARALLVPD
jgi:5'-3' exonuclease